MKYICKLHIIWNNFFIRSTEKYHCKVSIRIHCFYLYYTLNKHISNMFLHFTKLSQKKWIVQIFFYPYHICIQQSIITFLIYYFNIIIFRKKWLNAIKIALFQGHKFLFKKNDVFRCSNDFCLEKSLFIQFISRVYFVWFTFLWRI